MTSVAKNEETGCFYNNNSRMCCKESEMEDILQQQDHRQSDKEMKNCVLL